MMTASARELLDAFDRLTDPDRQALAAEILRRSSEEDLPPPGDEELATAAEELFLELDAWEEVDARP